MPEDRSIFLGLNTDAPPDRLENQAFRVKNVVPTSPTTIAPRGGTELVKHYQPMALGRPIVVDGLPGDLGGGVLVVCMNVVDAGAGDGRLTQRVDGVYVFRPELVAADYESMAGVDLSDAVQGVVY